MYKVTFPGIPEVLTKIFKIGDSYLFTFICDDCILGGHTQYIHAYRGEVVNIESAKNYLGGGFNKLFDFLSIGG